MIKKLIGPILLILVLVIAISCDDKMSEKTKLSIQGKTFNIEFNNAPLEKSSSPESSSPPEELTITFDNDVSDLYWIALFSNYGTTNYKEGNISITTSENANSFKIEEKVAEESTSSTSFTVTFNDNNKVSINGTIANNPIPETAQTTIVESTKSDTLNAFKGRTYFGTQDKEYSSTAGRLVFYEDKIEYTLYTNHGTSYVSDKLSVIGSYEDASFINNKLTLPHNESTWSITYDPKTDRFFDGYDLPTEADRNILKRIK